ncbi:MULTISPECIES: hypothetical protein [unclassified Rhizobium]|uniref:hypothetical protein n=1 Tax=unclassified Rhizobium TaxID=2613769 RepID=UPI0025D0399F|nr:hypothetical protein [Rhizobium sp. UBA1881]
MLAIPDFSLVKKTLGTVRAAKALPSYSSIIVERQGTAYAVFSAICVVSLAFLP